ncbi:MAG: ABC transporter ATP-binding protein [Nitrospirae bacterium]|nr:ABC transporter ATP-binding protein [Nitrospirota bacterium]
MISLFNIRKVYNAGKTSEVVAVNGIDLDIEGNSVTVLSGPSGSGKTTLLSIIGCMSRPTEGRIILSGMEITSLSERFMTEKRRMTFGIIFQGANLIKGISVLENVLLPAYPCGERYGYIKGRAMQLLDEMDISDKANANVEWLSGGEAQRVTIARAMINNPSILIADEPTAHLDSRLSYKFMDIIEGIKKKGKTILIASHDPIVYDCSTVDRVVNLRDGRLNTQG